MQKNFTLSVLNIIQPKIQKNLNRNLTPLITLNIVILFFAKS